MNIGPAREVSCLLNFPYLMLILRNFQKTAANVVKMWGSIIASLRISFFLNILPISLECLMMIIKKFYEKVCCVGNVIGCVDGLR